MSERLSERFEVNQFFWGLGSDRCALGVSPSVPEKDPGLRTGDFCLPYLLAAVDNNVCCISHRFDPCVFRRRLQRCRRNDDFKVSRATAISEEHIRFPCAGKSWPPCKAIQARDMVVK